MHINERRQKMTQNELTATYYETLAVVTRGRAQSIDSAIKKLDSQPDAFQEMHAQLRAKFLSASTAMHEASNSLMAVSAQIAKLDDDYPAFRTDADPELMRAFIDIHQQDQE